MQWVDRVEGDGVVSNGITVGRGGVVDDLIGEEGEPVPVSILVDIGCRYVDCGSQTYEDGFNGPFELAE